MPTTSPIVQQVNDVLRVIILIDVVLLAVVTFVMVYFVIKYHKNRHPKSVKVHEDPLLEITWTVLPTILVIWMFYYGLMGYRTIRNVPANAFDVKVIGQQWQWKFEYPNGKQSDTLNVPIQKPIKLLLTSTDVIHGFYIPAYRVKRDCVPNMDNFLWFEAEKPESEDIMCTQYCGLYHAGMHTQVIAMTQNDFDKWYAAKDTTGTSATAVDTTTKKVEIAKK